MPAPDAMLPVQPCKKRRVLPCHEVLFGLIPLIPQASPYNLLHFSIVDINTWPKFHLFLLILCLAAAPFPYLAAAAFHYSAVLYDITPVVNDRNILLAQASILCIAIHALLSFHYSTIPLIRCPDHAGNS